MVNEISFTFGPESEYAGQLPEMPVFRLDSDGTINSGSEYVIKSSGSDYALAVSGGTLTSVKASPEDNAVSTDNDEIRQRLYDKKQGERAVSEDNRVRRLVLVIGSHAVALAVGIGFLCRGKRYLFILRVFRQKVLLSRSERHGTDRNLRRISDIDRIPALSCR